MPRLLAIDFGEKRVGLATCDATGQVVAARRTLRRARDTAVVEEIGRFCREEEVEGVVLGLPRGRDGSETALTKRVRSFGDKIARATGLPLVYHDEALTSWQAARDLTAPAKEEIDRSAAAVLLTDYLAHVSEGRR
jgi:putative Holliday junction resolvase